MNILLEHERCVLFHGDSSQLDLPENSIDAIVTDPPAAIGLMNKEWDSDRGGFGAWTSWLADALRPSLRALKPGGYAFVWALPSTSHWTAVALELAGFEIWDIHHHIFGTGMPATANIPWLIDRHLGHDRKSTAAPISDEARAAAESGMYGTAFKPAVEHWILARKPLAGTYAANILEFGTGALNIEAGRIGEPPTDGRWPSHLSLEHAPGCTLRGTEVEALAKYETTDTARDGVIDYGLRPQTAGRTVKVEHDVYACALGCPVRLLDTQSGATGQHSATTGEEPSAPDGKFGKRARAKSGKPRRDPGGASKFFYVAKAARGEKDDGLGHITPKTGGQATGRQDGSAGTRNPRAGAGRTGGSRNHHPTVKSLDLMRWLLRLVTPAGGTVLDPFAGSGSTGVAALGLGLSFIGCELGGDEGEYLPIYVGRIRAALGLPPADAAAPETTADGNTAPVESV